MYPRCSFAVVLSSLAAALSGCGGGGGSTDSCGDCVEGPHNLGMAAADFERNGGVDVAAVDSVISTRATYFNVYLRGANGQYGAPESYGIIPQVVDHSLLITLLDREGRVLAATTTWWMSRSS